MRIYVASSWRNEYFDHIVLQLREVGHEVYDFKNAPQAFHWTQVVKAMDPSYSYDHGDRWVGSVLAAALTHPLCDQGFNQDMDALTQCEACVLVLPCGKSAHLEAGWAVGAGKRVVVHIPGVLIEPELMYKMTHKITTNLNELLEALK